MKHRFTLLILPFIVLPVLFYGFIHKSPFYIFPSQEHSIDAYDDHSKGGFSRIQDTTITDSCFAISYTLKKGHPFPYCGINISTNKEYYPDFSQYDYMELKLSTTTSRSVQLFLEANEPGITKPDIPITRRYVLYEVPAYQKKNLYTLWLKDFQTPIWWYNLVKVPEKAVGPVHWEQIKVISFSSSVILPMDTPDEIRVSGIVLKKSYRSFFFISISCFAFYYLVLLSIYLYKRRIKRIPTRIIPYSQLEIKEPGSTLEKIIHYISVHYHEELFSLDLMAKEIGISAREISTQIKKEYNLNFKQYLNEIRMHEAKRLLKKTTLNVSEIAYKVGFSNISHFNRTFKQYCDSTPLAYRTNETGADA